MSPTPSGWIAVTDRLPERNDEVLIWSSRLGLLTGSRCEWPDVWAVVGVEDCEFHWTDVTHWMPAPERPKEAISKQRIQNAVHDAYWLDGKPPE